MRRAIVLSMLAALSFCWVMGAAATVQAAGGSYTVGRWAFNRLGKAHELIGKEKYEEARELIDEMKERQSRLNDHEKALMWQAYAFIYSSKEQYKKAVEAFEQCLGMNAMAEGATTSTMYQLGQLYLATGQNDKAVKTLESWFSKSEKPLPSAHYLMAMAYVQTKQPKKALGHAKTAVARVSNPAQSWLQLLVSLYFELGQNRNVVAVLKRLIHSFPKRTYWLQLSAIYGELNDEARALAVLELAHRQGYLEKDTEYLNFGRMYFQQGIPLKAAAIVREGQKKGVLKDDYEANYLLASALMGGREYDAAVSPLESAAKQSKDGELYLQLAQLHLNREKYSQAVAGAQAAIRKGGLKNVGNAYLMMGVAHHEAGNRSKSRKAFQEALRFPKSKKAAKQWLKMLRQEVQPPGR